MVKVRSRLALILLSLFILQIASVGGIYHLIKQNHTSQRQRIDQHTAHTFSLLFSEADFATYYHPAEKEIQWKQLYYDICSVERIGDQVKVTVIGDEREGTLQKLAKKNPLKPNPKNTQLKVPLDYTLQEFVEWTASVNVVSGLSTQDFTRAIHLHKAYRMLNYSPPDCVVDLTNQSV